MFQINADTLALELDKYQKDNFIEVGRFLFTRKDCSSDGIGFKIFAGTFKEREEFFDHIRRDEQIDACEYQPLFIVDPEKLLFQSVVVKTREESNSKEVD